MKKKTGKKPIPVLDRMFTRTNIPRNKDGTPSKSQCWVWQGVVNNAGYGMLRVSSDVHMATVHRISFIEHTKQINYGDKIQVLHNCGNRLCVNPHHLKLGNTKDRAALQRKYESYNKITFFDKEKMWPVCEHCGGTTYMPHFKRLHRVCEHNAKHKYITDQLSGKT